MISAFRSSRTQISDIWRQFTQELKAAAPVSGLHGRGRTHPLGSEWGTQEEKFHCNDYEGRQADVYSHEARRPQWKSRSRCLQRWHRSRHRSAVEGYEVKSTEWRFLIRALASGRRDTVVDVAASH